MKDDISIFVKCEERGDDWLAKATINKNGNSFESHAFASSIEEAEDNAIQRAKLLAGIQIDNKL